MRGMKFLTRTALILALTVGFQSLRPYISLPPPMSNYIIGSLVNASLAAASVLVGAWSGLLVSILAPVVALMQQHIVFPWLVPIIAGGNALYVLILAWWYRRNKPLAIVLASAAKFLFLYYLVMAAVNILVVPQPAAGALSLMFGWSQLITAMAGGFVALPVIKRIRT
ncbi:MAG: ECF transporter S component [Clostridia bacterium]|jgi:hypothetical protein|nr:ECF transporter S component [Clostridiales bacterium]